MNPIVKRIQFDLDRVELSGEDALLIIAHVLTRRRTWLNQVREVSETEIIRSYNKNPKPKTTKPNKNKNQNTKQRKTK